MRSSFFASLLLPVLILAACTGSPAEQSDSQVTQPAASDDAPVNDPGVAAREARQHLAERLGVDANDIVVEHIEPREWTDSCLGLGGPAESCLAAITPGFALQLVHDGKEYAYRTDQSGTVVRAE